MGNQARVTSTEALEAFRASLILFLAKARRAMADTGDEVKDTRGWLDHGARTHWENEMRRRTKIVERAQQELMSAQLSKENESARQARQQALNKARRDLAEAEDKLRRVKKWAQCYDTTVGPMVKRMEMLGHYVEHDIPKAIIYLKQVQDTLEAYAQAPAPEQASMPSINLPSESATTTTP